MKTINFVFAFILISATTLFGQSKADILNKIWGNIGGKKVWEQSRFIMFEFSPEKEGKSVMSRTHLWDRYTGDYSFEAQTADNKKLLVLFNVQNQKGKSFVDGKPASDSLNTANIKKAYAAFVNDSYWLLVPVKLEDPGVNVELTDPEEIEGKKYTSLFFKFFRVHTY